jgi:hypothetical protein
MFYMLTINRRVHQAALTMLLIFAAVPFAAVAQQSRVLYGTVKDGVEPVRGAVVQLENLQTLEVRSYVTQKDGAYHFTGLNPETDYQVWARRDDKESPKKMVSKFDSAARVKVDLALK